MPKIIYANVYVTTPTGETKLYLAGDEVPDEHVDLITAPVWDKPEGEESDEDTEIPTDPRQASMGQTADDAQASREAAQKAAAENAQVQAETDAQKAADAQALHDHLVALKKDELVEHAKANGIDVKGDETKDQLVETIKAQQA
jgi:cytoskeletal protein RodZ